MKIIYNKIIPFKGFIAINLFGVLFVREEYRNYIEDYPEYSREVINHETIHTAQMKETLYLGFYILYLIFWIIRLITPPWATAYKDISFEREAYANEHDDDYLKNRKPFAWTRYIFKKQA